MSERPTIWKTASFKLRVAGNQLRRHVHDRRHPLTLPSKADPSDYPFLIAERRTKLWTTTDRRENALEAGKVQNLRIAVQAVDNSVLDADSCFSFWGALGKCTPRKGYVRGRQLEGGCVVPAIGGGICQLSSSLYELALVEGLTVVERHAHTARVATSQAAEGLDATVAWNHIDLRFRSSSPVLLRSFLTSDELVVGIWSRRRHERPSASPVTFGQRPAVSFRLIAGSCETCGDTECHRHRTRPNLSEQQSAWLLDSQTAELRTYVRARARKDHTVYLPSRLTRQERYQWNLAHGRPMATLSVARRDWQAKKETNAPRRRQAALARADELARIYARRLDPAVRHLTVDIGLLLPLWRSGALGGRTFDVLAGRPPLATVHRLLDEAAAAFPDRPLLNDFRASPSDVRDEEAALAAASQIISAHALVINESTRPTVRLEWDMPPVAPSADKPDLIVFAGPVVSRQGCYEVKEVARRLGVSVAYTGSMLEGAGFWGEIPASPAPSDWVTRAKLVLAPCVVEARPRAILRAMAAGVPVVTTVGSGVDEQPGVHHLAFGDVDALEEVCRRLLLEL